MDSGIKKLVDHLKLQPHPEGGFFKETYRSEISIQSDVLGGNFSGARNVCTGIYFLLTSDNFSAFHRIKQDEMWHFYQGSPLLIHSISPAGDYECVEIGNDIAAGQVPQYVVPAGYWFASSVKNDHDYSLVGCTVSPGFDFDDFELAERESLIREFPEHESIIESLTRK